MNLTPFLEHWQITENPFRGEEARRDAVFARVGVAHDGARAATHPDFEKIAGEIGTPSTSVVFGEKGSGKTAIRLQIADRVARHNAQHPGRRVLLVPYDELNAFLDHLHEAVSRGRRGVADPAESFKKIRLVDHMDAVLSLGVARVGGALLGGAGEAGPADLGEEPLRRARQMSPGLKGDLVLLQGVYDRSDVDGRRTARLRAKLRMPAPEGRLGWLAAAWIGWLPAALCAALLLVGDEVIGGAGGVVQALGAVFALAWLGVLGKVTLWDRAAMTRVGARLARQLRFLGRTAEAYGASLRHVDRSHRAAAFLPLSGSDEQRYAMLDRLQRVLVHFGYAGILVIMDRVDEPTLVNGDAERMRSIVWPLFNNKFLQQQRLGVKMLLPIELRHALFRESAAFFQEARLDKQNLVERLTWTGAMLYDLCNARLNACRPGAAEPIALVDLFAEDVSRQDLVDALDQMHQPRDAFKFLYRCLSEHCANVTADQQAWRVPRLVLEQVRRSESDRVQQLYRGIRPA